MEIFSRLLLPLHSPWSLEWVGELLSLWSLSLWVTDVIEIKVISRPRITTTWGWVCAPLKQVGSLSWFPLRQGWQAPSQLTIRSQLTIFWLSLSWKDWISDLRTSYSKSEWSSTQAPLKVPAYFSCVEKMNNIFSKAICLYCIHEDYGWKRE